MNIREGARRMRRSGQWMIFIPFSIVVVLWVITLLFAPQHRAFASGHGDLLIITTVASLYSVIPGALLWLSGWILEGFAKEAE